MFFRSIIIYVRLKYAVFGNAKLLKQFFRVINMRIENTRRNETRKHGLIKSSHLFSHAFRNLNSLYES